jgi:hypothetical protein
MLKNSVLYVLSGLLITFCLGLIVYVYNDTKIPLSIYCVLIWMGYYCVIGGPISVTEYGRSVKSAIALFLLIIITIELANNYILYLANTWSIDISGWRHYSLNFGNMVLGAVFGFMSKYIDALLSAFFQLDSHPVTSFFRGVAEALEPDPSVLGRAGVGSSVIVFSGKLLANIGFGALSGILSTLLIRKFFIRKE